MEFDEAGWWGDCGNSFHEEQKQIVCAIRMSLIPLWDVGHPPAFDLEGRSVLDVGGGPVSLLLKCVNRGPACIVIDPTAYPAWTHFRYHGCGIEHGVMRGEDFDRTGYDEAWCYNVLQHVDDPERIAVNMRAAAPHVRVFEWIDMPAYPGHPQSLTEADLNRWFDTTGTVEDLDDYGAVGRAWYVG